MYSPAGEWNIRVFVVAHIVKSRGVHGDMTFERRKGRFRVREAMNPLDTPNRMLEVVAFVDIVFFA
jgi:hypothetical protein